MPLSDKEKAEIVLAYLNKDKPHGMSPEEFQKKFPDPYVQMFTKSKGGADYKVEYGYNPQFSAGPQNGQAPALGSDPSTVLPYQNNQLPKIGQAVMAQDPDIVYSMYGLLNESSRKKIDKMLEQRGKQGFIQEARASAQFGRVLDDKAEALKPNEPIEEDGLNPVILTGKKMEPATNKRAKLDPRGSGKKVTKAGNIDKRGKKGPDNIKIYHDFCKKFKTEPIYEKVEPSGRRQTISCVYELLKELETLAKETKDPREREKLKNAKTKFIKHLNTTAGGSAQPKSMTYGEIVKHIHDVRQGINKANPKVQVMSKKITDYYNKQKDALGM